MRSRVHEYGGGAYLVDGRRVYFVNFADQRVYALNLERGRAATAADARGRVSATPTSRWTAPRRRLICVREDHTEPGREAVTTLVGIALDGGPVDGAGVGRRLLFDAAHQPRRHAPVLAVVAPSADAVGRHRAVGGSHRRRRCAWRRDAVAGGEQESIYQPGWLPDGSLVFASDRDGWWRLYRAAPPFTRRSCRCCRRRRPRPSSAGRSGSWPPPPGPAPATTSWSCRTRGGPLAAGARGYGQRHADADRARTCSRTSGSRRRHPRWRWWRGGAATADAVMLVSLDGRTARTLKRASDVELDPASVSEAEAMEFPTTERPAGARLLLPAAQRGSVGAVGRASAADRDRPRRSDRGGRAPRSTSRSSSGPRAASRSWT